MASSESPPPTSSQALAQLAPRIDTALGRNGLDRVLSDFLDVLGTVFEHCIFFLYREGVLKGWAAGGQPEARRVIGRQVVVRPDGPLARHLCAAVPQSFAPGDLAGLASVTDLLGVGPERKFLLTPVAVRGRAVGLLYLGAIPEIPEHLIRFVATASTRLAVTMASRLGPPKQAAAMPPSGDLPLIREGTARFAEGLLNGTVPDWRRMDGWQPLGARLLEGCRIPLFGGGGAPGGVEEAEAVVSPSIVCCIALAWALRELTIAPADRPAEIRPWERAACTALTAHELGLLCGQPRALCFAAGLLRHVGAGPLAAWKFPKALIEAVASEHLGANPATVASLAADLCTRLDATQRSRPPRDLHHMASLPALGLSAPQVADFQHEMDLFLPWAARL